MLDQLGEVNCPENLYKLTESFVRNREVTYEKNGANVTKKYTRGFSQGNNLGPLLWNVVSDPALRLDLGKNTYMKAYTDDFILVVSEKGRNTFQNKAKAC